MSFLLLLMEKNDDNESNCQLVPMNSNQLYYIDVICLCQCKYKRVRHAQRYMETPKFRGVVLSS